MHQILKLTRLEIEILTRALVKEKALGSRDGMLIKVLIRFQVSRKR